MVSWIQGIQGLSRKVRGGQMGQFWDNSQHEKTTRLSPRKSLSSFLFLILSFISYYILLKKSLKSTSTVPPGQMGQSFGIRNLPEYLFLRGCVSKIVRIVPHEHHEKSTIFYSFRSIRRTKKTKSKDTSWTGSLLLLFNLNTRNFSMTFFKLLV